MSRRLSTAAIGAVLITAVSVASLVSGCSGSPEWRSGGTQLEKLDESLLAVEIAWRASVKASPVKANLSDSSGCYFQVVHEHEVTGDVLCGPVRYVGAETSWQSAPVEVTPTDADTGYLTLSLTGGKAQFIPNAKPAPGAEPLRPDGTKADLAATLDEPPARAAKAGDVLPWPTPMPATAAKGKLTTPLGSHALVVAVLREPFGGATDRVAPPAGGSFVLVSTTTTSRTIKADGSDAHIVVSTAGKEYAVAAASNSTSPLAIAIPSDGKDAKVGVSYDGLTQWIDAATGARSGSAAAGYYDNVGLGAVGQCPDVDQGRRAKGWHRTFSCGVTLTRVPYLPKPTEGSRKIFGWAKDGMVFVSVDYVPGYFATWSDGASSPVPYDSTLGLQSSLVVAGKPYAPVETSVTQPGTTGSGTVIAIFEVPAAQAAMTLKGTATFTDTLAPEGRGSGAPASGTGSFPVSITMTITP